MAFGTITITAKHYKVPVDVFAFDDQVILQIGRDRRSRLSAMKPAAARKLAEKLLFAADAAESPDSN